MFDQTTVIATSVPVDVGPGSAEQDGFIILRLSDGQVIVCPRLLTGQHLTALLKLPRVILSRVGHHANGDFFRAFRQVCPDSTLHNLANYNELLLSNYERLGHIEQLYEAPR